MRKALGCLVVISVLSGTTVVADEMDPNLKSSLVMSGIGTGVTGFLSFGMTSEGNTLKRELKGDEAHLQGLRDQIKKVEPRTIRVSQRELDIANTTKAYEEKLQNERLSVLNQIEASQDRQAVVAVRLYKDGHPEKLEKLALQNREIRQAVARLNVIEESIRGNSKAITAAQRTFEKLRVAEFHPATKEYRELLKSEEGALSKIAKKQNWIRSDYKWGKIWGALGGIGAASFATEALSGFTQIDKLSAGVSDAKVKQPDSSPSSEGASPQGASASQAR